MLSPKAPDKRLEAPIFELLILKVGTYNFESR